MIVHTFLSIVLTLTSKLKCVDADARFEHGLIRKPESWEGCKIKHLKNGSKNRNAIWQHDDGDNMEPFTNSKVN